MTMSTFPTFRTSTMPALGAGTGFGASTTSAFAGSTYGALQAQQQVNPIPPNYPQRLPATAESTIKSVREAWDPASPNCQFKHYFYNLVHPSEVKKYTRGPNDDEKLWEHAVKNNPDASCLVPALAVGFGDLKKRVQQQEAHLKNMKYRLGEIAIACDMLLQRHEVDNRVRIAEFRRKHQELAARTLKLMKAIHQLRNAGAPISLEEDKLRGKLEELLLRLRKPGQYKSKMASLWKEVTSVGDVVMSDANQPMLTADSDQLAKVLSEQFQGVQHLVDVLKNDRHDLDVIEKHLKQDKDAIYKDYIQK